MLRFTDQYTFVVPFLFEDRTLWSGYQKPVPGHIDVKKTCHKLNSFKRITFYFDKKVRMDNRLQDIQYIVPY